METVQLDIFYNTISADEDDLQKRKVMASNQNRAIYNFFRSNPHGYYTPFEVQKYSGLLRTPITSIRRALNTLTEAKLISKESKMKNGEYGVPNHTWKLKQ